MAQLVLDASAIVDGLLGRDYADTFWAAVREMDAELHIPAHCDIEVVSALRLGIARACTPLMLLAAQSSITPTCHSPVTRRRRCSCGPWLRDNFTASDAAYVALGESLEGCIVTADGPLRRAIEGRFPALV